MNSSIKYHSGITRKDNQDTLKVSEHNDLGLGEVERFPGKANKLMVEYCNVTGGLWLIPLYSTK